MKRILLLLSIICTAVIASSARAYTPADVPDVQKADSTRLVVNPDGIISPAAEARMNLMLRDIRSKTTAEVVVVAIDDMADGYDIDNFATYLFDRWKIGKKDVSNGVLVVVAKDARRYVVRTGYGTEGLLPDVLCARIGREILAPAFREGDYDGGLVQAVSVIHDVMTDPAARQELMSKQKDDGDLTLAEFFNMYLIFSAAITVILLLMFIGKLIAMRGKSDYDKYNGLRTLRTASGVMCFLCLGLPLAVYLPIRGMMNTLRNGVHKCPNCGTKMNKLDEETDNRYLTAAQDTEEHLGSVDYDVWLCPNCGETDIYAYPNSNTKYTECPQCHAKACTLRRDRILVRPTTKKEGYGEKEYECRNCKHIHKVSYKIPKEESVNLGAAATIGILSSLSGRGGSGGGFGGGGFGGGMTGGGGASGGW